MSRAGARARPDEAGYSGAAWPAATVVVLLVLAVDPWATQSFTVAKWLVLCAGVPAGLVAAGRTGRVATHGWRPWLAMSVIVGAATVAGHAPILSFVGGPYRNLGAVAWLLWWAAFALGASSAGTPTRERVLESLFAATGATGAIAVVQRVGVDPFGIQSSLDRSRAWGTFGNASLLGAFGALVLPIAIARLHDRAVGSGRWRAWPTIGAAGAAVSLATAGSRGALVGAIAGLLVLAFLRRPARNLALVGVAAVALIGLLVPGTSERVLGQSELAASTASGRLDQWGLSLELIGDRPVLGSGPETYRLRFPAVIDDDFERDHGGDVVHDRAHNLVLDLGVTVGIVGIAAFGWLVVSAGVALRRRGDGIAVAVASGAAAYLVQLLFSYQDAHLDAVVWLLVGVGLAHSRAVDGARSQSWRVARTVTGIVAALALGAWAARDVVADHRLDAALRSSDPGAIDGPADLAPDRLLYHQVAGRRHQSIGSTDEAIASFDRALEIAPDDVSVLLDRAQAEATASPPRLDAARETFERILSDIQPVSGRAELGYGVVLARLGAFDDAARAWERAATLRPDDADPLRNLGRLALLDGRADDAVLWFTRVLDRQPGDAEALEALDSMG